MAEHLVTVALFTMGQLKPVFLSDCSEKGGTLSVKSAPSGSRTERVPSIVELIGVPVGREPADFYVTVVLRTVPEQLE